MAFQNKVPIILRIFITVFLLAAVPGAANAAELEWVEFTVPGGAKVKALFARPDETGPFPAVMYNHGTKVREDGYQISAGDGYDVKDFVRALSGRGFAALAPIRDHLSELDYSEAIPPGIEAVSAAYTYLRARPEIDKERIGMVGFSEGGLVTTWVAQRLDSLKAVVLLSPASMRDARRYNLKTATARNNLEKITAPVFLTMGRNDHGSIKKNVNRRLIPNMESLGKDFRYKTDYLGDHRWFWKPRAAYFNDVLDFLEKRLKK